MFTNLKNKLIEEVKASPSKFQQLANAAQAAVASSTTSGSDTTATTTNENFFSITEEDTPQNSPFKPLKHHGAIRGRSTPLSNGTGAIPRTRKLSNSSMASDISFRLPSYDSAAVYHLQSDFEETASEMDDSASTSNNLDALTKEKLYDAYKKSLERYHKYRCRYTDLAKKYKDLEHDSTKARSVLVETQEKAIRRINELREQCSLEQQAKAHLEEALRVEMDDMQCKMQAYQTKLKLLGENPENITAVLEGNINSPASESLIDLGNSSQNGDNTTTNNLINIADVNEASDANEKVSHLETQLRERESKLKELTEKIEKSNETIEMLRKQEEENALLLAQTKQAIHSELEDKDNEVRKLNDSIKQIQNELQVVAAREKQASSQIGELKVHKEKLKQAQAAKQEVDAKIIATEHTLTQLREQYAAKEKTLLTAEEKIVALSKENEQKLQDLRQQNAQLSEMVNRYQQHEVSLAEVDNELNRTKNENDNLRAALTTSEQKLLKLESELNGQKEYLEKNSERQLAEQENFNAEKLKVEQLVKELEDEKNKNDSQVQKITQLERELNIMSEQNAHNESETIAALQAELHKMNTELGGQVNALKEQLSSKEKEFKTNGNKLTKQKKQHETQQNRMKEQSAEIEKLKTELNTHEQHLQSMQTEATMREEQTEHEKNELRSQVTNILHEISQMEVQMRVVQHSHAELEQEKRILEGKIENMQRQTQDANEGTQHWRELLNETEGKLQQVETKLQSVESENTQLAERNCLLEESSNRLEKLLAERERSKATEETTASEMRLQLETAEDAVQKLNEKMSQVLDENSRMHNAQELMDHDYRTLQDKFDALEKEKLIVEDGLKCLETEVAQFKDAKLVDESKIHELTAKLQDTEQKCLAEVEKAENVVKELSELRAIHKKLEHDKETLRTQMDELRATQADDDKLRDLLQEKQKDIEKLKNELHDKVNSYETTLGESEQKLAAYQEQESDLAKTAEMLERSKEEMELLRAQKESLSEELLKLNEQLSEESTTRLAVEQKCKEFEAVREEFEMTRAEMELIKERESKLNAELEEQQQLFAVKLQEENKLQNQVENLNALSDELENKREELRNAQNVEESLRAELTASKEQFAAQLRDLEAKLSTANEDVEKLHESNDAFEVEIDKLNSKHQAQVQDLESSLKHLQQEHGKLQTQLSNVASNAQKLENYDQMQIENEYVNKQVKQLESEIEAQKQETLTKTKELEEHKEKLKSIQCELYVLKENAEKHDAQLNEKEEELKESASELQALKDTLVAERSESERQSEHAKYITEQNDGIQKDLLHSKQHYAELEQKLTHKSAEFEQLRETNAIEAVAHEKQITGLRVEIERNQQTIETLNKEVNEISEELQVKEKLQEELKALKVELEERTHHVQEKLQQSTTDAASRPAANGDAEQNLRKINETLQRELEDLKHKSTAHITNLQQEIEDLQNNGKQMTERILELEQLRAGLQAQKLFGFTPTLPEAAATSKTTTSTLLHSEQQASAAQANVQQEKEELELKLKEIMNEVQDVSNRNLFLEQKCENYLILEQSNERLKSQNAKLSRQLDETLVSMQHNENISANTEFEYLKNIMFQYLTGSANGNNETLVKVISAVLKFTPQQTQVALEKEHQRRSLINKIL